MGRPSLPQGSQLLVWASLPFPWRQETEQEGIEKSFLQEKVPPLPREPTLQ